MLTDILPLAPKYGKVIVIHCRDNGDGRAADDMLKILCELKLKGVPIHRHCFTGNAEEIEKWKCNLSSVYFGFTSMLLKKKLLQDVIKHLDIKKILLESDAPYLGSSKYETCTPWEVLKTAQMVATIKGITLEDVLQKTRQNTANLYRFR